MSKFQVTSHRLSGKAFGSTVTAEELEGANIEALVESGHLLPLATKPKKDEAKAEDK